MNHHIVQQVIHLHSKTAKDAVSEIKTAMVIQLPYYLPVAEITTEHVLISHAYMPKVYWLKYIQCKEK